MSGAEDVVKYLNWASPVGAGWGASLVWERNSFIGTVMIVYVVVWAFANVAALMVLIQRHVGEFRQNMRPKNGGN